MTGAAGEPHNANIPMSFEERAQRVTDALADRVREHVVREPQAAGAQLAAITAAQTRGKVLILPITVGDTVASRTAQLTDTKN